MDISRLKFIRRTKRKIAFFIGNGLWQFKVMPFGLCNAPTTFERAMEQILQKFLSKICLVYLDDVIIFSKTFEEMIENLKKYFLERKVNLKINPEKCILFEKK